MTPNRGILWFGCHQVFLENKTMLAAVLVMDPIEEAMLEFSCTSIVCWGKGCVSVCRGPSVVLKNWSSKKTPKIKEMLPQLPICSICFCGVNITIMTNFKLSRWHHWTWSRKEMSIICSCEPIEAGFSLPLQGQRRGRWGRERKRETNWQEVVLGGDFTIYRMESSWPFGTRVYPLRAKKNAVGAANQRLFEDSIKIQFERVSFKNLQIQRVWSLVTVRGPSIILPVVFPYHQSLEGSKTGQWTERSKPNLVEKGRLNVKPSWKFWLLSQTTHSNYYIEFVIVLYWR